MTTQTELFFFDLIDPLSYLTARALVALRTPDAPSVAWTPFELRPPPTPLVGLDDPSLTTRWGEAHREAEEEGLDLSPPSIVPWSRKAHELCLYAREQGVGEEVTMAAFHAYLIEGRDIGRVDVLVDIGCACGLDLTETKAVLDVDRFESLVLEARSLGSSMGVGDVPTLISGNTRLEGFHNRTALGTFLPRA